jgi:hypothetical protein
MPIETVFHPSVSFGAGNLREQVNSFTFYVARLMRLLHLPIMHVNDISRCWSTVASAQTFPVATARYKPKAMMESSKDTSTDFANSSNGKGRARG